MTLKTDGRMWTTTQQTWHPNKKLSCCCGKTTSY